MSRNKELIEAAQAARAHAYAPYSGYPVGAAVLDEHGKIHAGCNVENVSYPVGMCAERGAIAQMVANGGREIRAVAVVTRDGGTPCGMCRQAIAEFVRVQADVEVVTVSETGEMVRYSVEQLLPHGFKSREVEQK